MLISTKLKYMWLGRLDLEFLTSCFFLRDIHKSTKFLSIIFFQDSPSNKLLYAKEISNYKKMVEE